MDAKKWEREDRVDVATPLGIFNLLTKQSSRHIPCAVTLKKQSFLRISGRHTECACYSLNGIGLKSATEFTSVDSGFCTTKNADET